MIAAAATRVKLWRCRQCGWYVATEELHAHLIARHQTRALDSALIRFFEPFGAWGN